MIRVPDPRTDSDAALAAVNTALQAVGWQPATVAGRPCALDQTPEQGEFVLRAVPHGDPPMELTACSTSWFSDLNAMVQHLEENGWTSVELGSNADTAGLRPATTQEMDDRARYACERAAPLIALLLPNSPA